MPDRVVIARALLALLLLGVVGTLAELLLLGHSEGWQQWVPLVLLGLGIPVVAVGVLRRATRPPFGLLPLMGLYLLSGALGTWLHYRGNAEFELEMAPDAHGWGLFREAMTGATPALAPGTMVWFGLLGLVAWKLLSTDRSFATHSE